MYQVYYIVKVIPVEKGSYKNWNIFIIIIFLLTFYVAI